MSRSFSATEARQSWIIMGAVVLCAVLTFLLPGWVSQDAPISPTSGLMTQRALAQQAMPYEVALSNGKPTLIEFYADWCTTCQAFAPTLEQLHDQLGARVNFVMLNIDDPQWKDPIEQFEATGVPHLTLLDADHSPIETWIGKVPASVLFSRTETLLS